MYSRLVASCMLCASGRVMYRNTSFHSARVYAPASCRAFVSRQFFRWALVRSTLGWSGVRNPASAAPTVFV